LDVERRRFTARATGGKTRAPLKPTLEGERSAIKRENERRSDAPIGEQWREDSPSRDFFRGSYEQTVRRAAKTPGKARENPSIPPRAEKETVVGES
jgi:hypothetical protein